MHHGTHQFAYVIFSILVAVLGSWTALDLQRQVCAHGGRVRIYWLSAAALAMGLSIFTMHFIAMLGFDIGMPVRYDLWLTVGSLAIAIGATFFAFIAVQTNEPTRLRITFAGLAMGAGICLMHYVGMAAIRAPAVLSYDPWLVTASLVIAVVVSWAALYAALWRPRLEFRLIGALILGLAISSMHYTAMAAASFTPALGSVIGTGGIDQLGLALGVGTGTMVLLFFALVSAMFDRRFQALALREAAVVAAKEAHLREVLTSMPMAVLVVPKGDSRHIAFANPLARDLLNGMHPAELPLHDLLGNPLEETDHPFCAAVTRGDAFGGRLVMLKSGDGRARYLEVSASTLRDGAGDTEQVILTAQDVTSRVEAEQALQQNQKLETIGQLTGGVAHDFNNLLTPIVGGLDLLRRDQNLSSRSRRVVDGALLAATRAATLVQRLLAFSRRQILQPQPVDMATILSGLRDLIERSIGPSVQVTIEAEPDLVAIVDPGQFELAVLNLAVNARDAMPEGGRLTIAASAESLSGNNMGLPGGAYVRIQVADTGIGMDEATVQRAIEPFFSTKKEGKGTGLGLSMVHGLAAQSSGALLLKSSPGEGTCAELWLPLAREAPSQETVTDSGSLLVPNTAKILLVDDEELVRGATAEMLKEMGHEVIEAASGAEAVALLGGNADIDLVITDHLMPGMSGVELSRELRATGHRLPIALITGYANPQELPESLPKLKKPFTAANLRDFVAEILSQQAPNVVDLTRRRRQAAD